MKWQKYTRGMNCVFINFWHFFKTICCSEISSERYSSQWQNVLSSEWMVNMFMEKDFDKSLVCFKKNCSITKSWNVLCMIAYRQILLTRGISTQEIYKISLPSMKYYNPKIYCRSGSLTWEVLKQQWKILT